MTEHMFKHISVPPGDGEAAQAALNDQLRQYEKEGWDVMTITPVPDAEVKGTKFLAVFKKPLSPGL